MPTEQVWNAAFTRPRSPTSSSTSVTRRLGTPVEMARISRLRRRLMFGANVGFSTIAPTLSITSGNPQGTS